MRVFLILLSLAVISPAFAQQPQPPLTADQITIQLMEQELSNYRRTIGQLAVQINALTKERDELKAKQPAQEPGK